MNLTVWVLFHRWDGDESSTLFSTKYPGVRTYLASEYHEDMEWYNIYSQKVNFPGLEIPDEEVVLTSDECAIVVMALELEGLATLAVGTGLAPNEETADELIQSAYQKLKD